VFGIIFALLGALVTWRRGGGAFIHVVWSVVTVCLGALAIIGGMFVISVLYYAPSALLEKTADAASAHTRQVEQDSEQPLRRLINTTISEIERDLPTIAAKYGEARSKLDQATLDKTNQDETLKELGQKPQIESEAEQTLKEEREAYRQSQTDQAQIDQYNQDLKAIFAPLNNLESLHPNANSN
jgi:hypothetical protein